MAAEEERRLFDVDKNIPVARAYDPNSFCIIIANEDYRNVSKVDFAVHDGEVFHDYCTRTLGMPEKNIKMYKNASLSEVYSALQWLKITSEVNGDDTRLFFYYAGHGMPGEADKKAYLLPADADPQILRTCIPLADIYKELGSIKAECITVFLDACFSGAQRGENNPNNMLTAARGVAIKAQEETLPGNMVTFTAASGSETAYSFKKRGHGMFTYFLLNQLASSRGNISYGELFDTLKREVKKNSWKENEKMQTPTVTVSGSLESKWRDLHFIKTTK